MQTMPVSQKFISQAENIIKKKRESIQFLKCDGHDIYFKESDGNLYSMNALYLDLGILRVVRHYITVDFEQRTKRVDVTYRKYVTDENFMTKDYDFQIQHSFDNDLESGIELANELAQEMNCVYTGVNKWTN